MLSKLQPLGLVPLLLLSMLACRGRASSVQVVPAPPIGPENRTSSQVFVLRDGPLFEGSVLVRVYENDRLVGRITEGHFLNWTTSPGRKLLSAVVERRGLDGGDIRGITDILCEPGKTLYYVVRFSSENQRKPALKRLDERKGAELLRKQMQAEVDIHAGSGHEDD